MLLESSFVECKAPNVLLHLSGVMLLVAQFLSFLCFSFGMNLEVQAVTLIIFERLE